MSFEIHSNLHGLAKRLTEGVVDQMHEAMANGVAAKAREHGLSTADNIDLDLTSDSDDPTLQIDVERVRARANEILASDG